MKIVCLGDSCTFGQNVRYDEAWPHVLAQMTGHDVRNMGVCGDTTRLGLERFHRDVELQDPDVVVLQFGHNDVNEWDGRPRVSENAYRANIVELKVRSVVSSIVLAPHICKTPKDDAYNNRLLAYARGLAMDLSVPLLDDGYGVHPSVEGHRIYAEYVAGLL